MPQSSQLFVISKMPNIITPSCIPLLVLALCFLVLYSTFYHQDHPGATSKNYKSTLFYESTFLSSASNYTIATYLRHLTLQPHLAGTPPSRRTALYVYNHFKSHHLSTHITNYSTLLSYPTRSSLTAHFGNGSVIPLPLSEPGLSRDVVVPFHAYSPSDTAYGEAVFLNYGREQDYRALSGLGVQVKNCVGIIRRGGGMTRHAAVETAEAHGVAAVLMYTQSNSNRFSRGVERGTVMEGVGDPLSPGWPAVDGGEKLALDDPLVTRRFPTIPSMPVSAEVADTIMSSLEGAKVPHEWKDSSGNCNKIGRVGPGPIMLNFTYQAERKMATIQNVFAVIQGSEEPDRFVLLGNHRDAWTYGAVDPNSGTAALLDIARRFSLLMRLGWNPKRTIVLCSWDAEEFGMIGSTEWVEQNIVNLGSKSVAYLNVDCAVQGPGFFAGASPQLDDLLIQVAKKVKDPDSGNMMLYEKWKSSNAHAHIQRLSGVDSDFAPFLQHAGVPSVDIYYGEDFPVYHTAFDSYDWMVSAGDPLFQRHVAVTGIWGLLALHLADDQILPFNYLAYAEELQRYTRALSNLLEGSISILPMADAVHEFTAVAKKTGEEIKNLREHEPMDENLLLKSRILNDRLILAERGFLDPEGIQGRPWFKHLVYGPQSDPESHLNFFPGVLGAISRSTQLKESERRAAIEHEIWRVARSIQRAAGALRGSLT